MFAANLRNGSNLDNGFIKKIPTFAFQSIIVKMKKILHSYKLRLTNISQGSRALKLAKLSPRRDIDWCELGFLEGESAEDLLQKVIAGKPTRLIQKLDARFEKTNIADKRLGLIYREIQSIFEETGTQDLYIGYPFVEGKFADGTVVRCPVLLFPVHLIRNLQGKPRWAVKPPEDAEIMYNPTFFLAYELYQNSRIPKEFWEDLPEYSEDWQDFLNKLYEKLKKYEIEINFNADLFQKKLDFFTAHNKESLEQFPLGQLKFQSQAVLGIFPQSDSALMQDYETIEANPQDFDLEALFNPQEPTKPVVEFRPEFMPEETRFFVTDIDQSQEEAILKVKAGKSIVLHGPPGTGKSQVIVNLIAEGMAQGKKILIVSQKRAALDVVYKRLVALGLGRFAALVHDSQTDRLPIFQKIRQQIDDIPTFQKEVHDIENLPQGTTYDVWARQADNLKYDFEQLHKALTQKHSCGLSAHELYLLCDREKATLNLAAPAEKMDALALQHYQTKLYQLMDYEEFFATDYPWNPRISFHHYRHEDKFLLAEKIQKCKENALILTQSYSELAAILSPETDLSAAKKTVLHAQTCQSFQQAETHLKDAFLHSGIAAIYSDNLSEKQLEKQLYDLSQAFLQLRKCTLLAGFNWETLISLGEKMGIYSQKKNDLFRFTNTEYRKSLAFIDTIFQYKNKHWSEHNYLQLEEEYQIFHIYYEIFQQISSYTFFQDFEADVLSQGGASMNPLQAEEKGILLQGWNEWLDAKKQQFEAWKTLQNLPQIPALLPVFEQGKLQQDKWKIAVENREKWEDFLQSFQQKKEDWALFLHEKQVEKVVLTIIDNPQSTFLVDLERTFLKDFEDLKQLDALLANFSEEENEILQAILPKIEAKTPKESLLESIKHSLYFYWLQNIEKENADLTNVSTRGFARKQDDFAHFLSEKKSHTHTYIQYVLKKRIAENNSPKLYKEMLHQTTKKRRLWTVRKLMTETWKQGLLPTLIPCWLASPESVAAIFPMEKDYFDWVIFDEASQCFVERALPVMLRGKQMVIAGDSKQLQPFDMYSVRYEEGELVESELALEVESALDLAKTHLEQSYLTWHYRSQDEELISFSNQAFYDGKLQVIPAATVDTLFQPPLEWIAVEGQWKNNQNVAEAERILALILEWIQKPNPPSMGIVTFNYHQQELIKDLIDKKLEELAESNSDLYEKFQATLQKTENEEFVGLFVKNIENVQGDERDIIIFSVAYSKNEQGKLPAQFGLLNLQGGENRLNVAITRARKKIYVVCSFQPAELATETAKFEGPKLFKRYLQYVKAIGEGRAEEAASLLQINANQADIKEKNNAIADFLAQKLTEKGYFVLRNFGDTRYKIDIVVKANAESRDFLLAIECEGNHYFSGASAKEREVYRRQLLLQRGWKVHRVWARNFWMDKEKEWTKVAEMLPETKGV